MIRAYLVTLAPALFRLSLLVPGVMALASPLVMIPTLLSAEADSAAGRLRAARHRRGR